MDTQAIEPLGVVLSVLRSMGPPNIVSNEQRLTFFESPLRSYTLISHL